MLLVSGDGFLVVALASVPGLCCACFTAVRRRGVCAFRCEDAVQMLHPVPDKPAKNLAVENIADLLTCLDRAEARLEVLLTEAVASSKTIEEREHQLALQGARQLRDNRRQRQLSCINLLVKAVQHPRIILNQFMQQSNHVIGNTATTTTVGHDCRQQFFIQQVAANMLQLLQFPVTLGRSATGPPFCLPLWSRLQVFLAGQLDCRLAAGSLGLALYAQVIRRLYQ